MVNHFDNTMILLDDLSTEYVLLPSTPLTVAYSWEENRNQAMLELCRCSSGQRFKYGKNTSVQNKIPTRQNGCCDMNRHVTLLDKIHRFLSMGSSQAPSLVSCAMALPACEVPVRPVNDYDYASTDNQPQPKDSSACYKNKNKYLLNYQGLVSINVAGPALPQTRHPPS